MCQDTVMTTMTIAVFSYPPLIAELRMGVEIYDVDY
jgi:hypothetical protein